MKSMALLGILLLFTLLGFSQKLNRYDNASSYMYFVNEKQIDESVEQLIDRIDVYSVRISGPPCDASSTLSFQSKKINLQLRSQAKYFTLHQFFAFYKVPAQYRKIIKVNGEVINFKENFIASSTKIDKVLLLKNLDGNQFCDIISKK
jgi:hypothetical protein